jgi:hypothetical protein
VPVRLDSRQAGDLAQKLSEAFGNLEVACFNMETAFPGSEYLVSDMGVAAQTLLNGLVGDAIGVPDRYFSKECKGPFKPRAEGSVKRKIKRAEKLTSRGCYAKALELVIAVALEVDPVASRRAMHRLHSPVPIPTDPAALADFYPVCLDPETEWKDISEEEVAAALSSSKRYSAGGLSGCSLDHLRDSSDHEEGRRLCRTLAYVLSFMVRHAWVPDALRPSVLVAIPKPGKDQKKDEGYRPIAIGETLKRLLCRILAARMTPRAQAYIDPQQGAVGAKDGTGQHLLVANIVQGGMDEASLFISLDLANAYNAIPSDCIPASMESVGYHPLVRAWITESLRVSSLSFKGESIKNARGVPQGDPLSGILFCIAFNPVLSAIRKASPVGITIDGVVSPPLQAFADDIAIAAPTREAGQLATDAAVRVCAKLHMPLRANKCVCISRSPANITILGESGARESIANIDTELGSGTFKYLGCPLGAEADCRRALFNKLEDNAALAEKIMTCGLSI